MNNPKLFFNLSAIMVIIYCVIKILSITSYASSECMPVGGSCPYGNSCPGECDQNIGGSYCSTDGFPKCASGKICNCWIGCCLVCKPGDCGTSTTCFLAGTKISMADGTKKNIEEVKVGDLVKSFDKNFNIGNFIVEELDNPVREGYYKIHLDDFSDTIISVTSEHPLYTKKAVGSYIGWGALDPIAAKNDSRLDTQKIVVGDYLLNETHTWNRITKIDFFPQSVPAYNLKRVQGANSFFADTYYAHNKDGGGTCDKPSKPTLTYPTNNSSVVSSGTVVFTWNAFNWNCNDGRTFSIWIDGAKVSDLAVGATSYTWTVPEALKCTNQNYTWQIRPHNNGGDNFSDTWTFNLDGNKPTCSGASGSVACVMVDDPVGAYTVSANGLAHTSHVTFPTWGLADGGQGVGGLDIHWYETAVPPGATTASTTVRFADALDASTGLEKTGIFVTRPYLENACYNRYTVPASTAVYCADIQVLRDTPPTGSIISFPLIPLIPETYTVGYPVTAVAKDIDSNLQSIQLYGRKKNPDSTWSSIWTELGAKKTCSSSETASCSSTVNWNPVCGDIGTWQVDLNVADSCDYLLGANTSGGVCTGNPDCGVNFASCPGWHDCGAGDLQEVTVANASPSAISWISAPTKATPNIPVTFSATATDDGNLALIRFYLTKGGTITPTISEVPCSAGTTCTASYSRTFTGADAGTYVVTAEAVDRCGGVLKSTETHVVVLPTFTLKTYYWDKSASNSCTSSPPSGHELSGVKVTLSGDSLNISRTVTTDSAGLASFTNVPIVDATSGALRLAFAYPQTGCDNYLYSCLNTTAASSTSLALTATAIYPPTGSLVNGSSYNIYLGLARTNSQNWFTSSGGSVYGAGISDPMCNLATPKETTFHGVIIENNTNAVAFTDASNFTSTPLTRISDPTNMYAQNLGVNGEYFKDIWLSKFVVTPGGASMLTVSAGTTLAIPSANERYQIKKSTLNAYFKAISDASPGTLATVTYKATSGSKGVSILYVVNDGNATDPLLISTKLVSNKPDYRLVIATEAPVKIAKNVGHVCTDTLGVIDCALKMTPVTPDIQALIVTSNSFITEATDKTPDALGKITMDMPVVIQGPVVSLLAPTLGRDLVTEADRYPSEYFLFDPSYLYSLVKLDRDHQEAISYSNLTTFDVQWQVER